MTSHRWRHALSFDWQRGMSRSDVRMTWQWTRSLVDDATYHAGAAASPIGRLTGNLSDLAWSIDSCRSGWHQQQVGWKAPVRPPVNWAVEKAPSACGCIDWPCSSPSEHQPAIQLLPGNERVCLGLSVCGCRWLSWCFIAATAAAAAEREMLCICSATASWLYRSREALLTTDFHDRSFRCCTEPIFRFCLLDE